MGKNKFPTPDAAGRERVSGNTGIRTVKITAIEKVIPLRDRTPKDVRVAVGVVRPLATISQIVTLHRSVTAATVVTNPEGDSFKYCLIYYFDNISVFRFNYRP